MPRRRESPHSLSLHLSERQYSRLRNGHRIRVAHKDLFPKHPNLTLHHVNPMMVEKAMKAYNRGAGSYIQLSAHEIQGNGLKEIFAHVKNAYHKYVKPHASKALRGAVTTGLDFLVDKANLASLGLAREELNSLKGKHGKNIVNKIGRYSGLYEEEPEMMPEPMVQVPASVAAASGFNRFQGAGTHRRLPHSVPVSMGCGEGYNKSLRSGVKRHKKRKAKKGGSFRTHGY